MTQTLDLDIIAYKLYSSDGGLLIIVENVCSLLGSSLSRVFNQALDLQIRDHHIPTIALSFLSKLFCKL